MIYKILGKMDHSLEKKDMTEWIVRSGVAPQGTLNRTQRPRLSPDSWDLGQVNQLL